MSEPSLVAPLPRRRWIIGGVALAVIIGGGITAYAQLKPVEPTKCGIGDNVVSAKAVDNPLRDPAGMESLNDDRLDELAVAVRAMPAPFGEVLGGLGFDYDQYLHIAGLDGALGAWTKDNALFTVLDGTSLKPRWGIENSKHPHAWDSNDSTFLNLDLVPDAPIEVSSYALTDGKSRWCAKIGVATKRDDPLGTAFLDSGDVLMLSPSAGKKLNVVKLAATTGKTGWQVASDSVGMGDFIGSFGDGLFVAGGAPQHELADATGVRRSKAGPVLTAFKTSTGKKAWSYDAPSETAVHVVGIQQTVGVADDQLILMSRGPGPTGQLTTTLSALDDEGEEVWTVDATPAALDATLRSGVLLADVGGAVVGYDAATGKPLWRKEIPTDKTYFPYGFELGQMPYLDADHVLMPTTTDLRSVSLKDGTETVYPLPADGINTTYWPYQLVVTPELIGVVTNIGGVVAARE